MIGKSIAQYRIIEMLGRGGMGVVYKAEDSMLKRTVAVKFLPQEKQHDLSARKRFLREAQSAGALNHPFICSIHEVGEFEGKDFIIMEYVDGQTLRERLEQGPLPLKEALQIALEVAEALEEAHEKGIVHRDLKPANIMLTRKGHAKVMDFGLAKLLAIPDRTGGRDETLSLMTREGTLVGTLAYMSPEQLTGRAIDARSDLFSLGIVFYEMFCGAHPFRAATPIATGDRILHQKPRSLAQMNPEVPAPLKQLIDKMVSKKPEDRPSGMKEVLGAFRNIVRDRPPKSKFAPQIPRYFQRRRLATLSLAVLLLLSLLAAFPSIRHWIRQRLQGTAVPSQMYLAVLPFDAVGATGETIAFCRGLTQTLNARLTRFTENHALQVVSSQEMRDQKIFRVDQARREFGVNLVLGGSLQQAAGMLRVSYYLMDAITRRQLRADTITASADDPFAMEDQVFASVVQNLEIDLHPGERLESQAQGTRQPAAYDYYLRGRGYLQEYYKRESVESAIAVFLRSLEQDSRYAPAFAGLGEAYWRMYKMTAEEKWVDQAQDSCSQAVVLNSALSTGHICLGTVNSGKGKHEQAIQEFQRAILLDPTSDDAYRGLAAAYENLGRLSEAERTYRRAIELRPQYWGGYNGLGGFYHARGQYREAAEMFSQAIKLAPDNYRGYSNLGGMYSLLGRYREAIPLYERSIALKPTGSAFSNLGTALFFQRQFSEAARAYEEAAKLDDHEWMIWGNLGDAYYWAPGKRAMASTAYRKAVTLADKSLRVNPRNAGALGYMAYYHAMLKEKTSALACAGKAIAILPADPELLFNIAMTHNQLGAADDAVLWLEKALAAGFSDSTIRDTPLVDNLRGKSKFQRLLQNR